MAAPNPAETLTRRPLYLYDLPREILDTLQLKEESEVPATSETPEDSTTASENATSAPETPSKAGIACTLCGLSFANVQEQRSHARSDLHGYNLKQKMRGLKPVNETDFEKMVGDLDESISGSDTESESESEEEDNTKSKTNGSTLSALLKRQANLDEPEEVETFGKKRKRGAGKPPLIWFKSSNLPSNTSLGVYRAVFTHQEQQNLPVAIDILRQKQLPSAPPPTPPKLDDDGGVPLPKAEALGPHIFLCMIGGGHFAAMIVSLKPKVTKVHGNLERQATVLAHKTFHRYTTRRKQGGAQSAADASKSIHSAGSSLRRANEVALETDIHQLLSEWKTMIDTSELLFIRATGTTNRRVLFGPYEGQVLRTDDSRNRGFPFSTRRATQAELMRCFVELTRVKVSVVDEAALAAAAAAAEEEAQRTAAASAAKAQALAASKAAKAEKSAEDETALLHTTQIEALIRRSKVPALLSYLSSNSLSADFELHPPFTQAHHHAPYPLHLAASVNSPAIITALLTKAKADPTLLNGDGKPAYDLAGDRATRDAFRLARSELGESAFDWSPAHVPEPLTKTEIEERARREKQEGEAAEAERRKVEMERLKAEERRKEEDRKARGVERTEKKHGKGHVVSAEERREDEARGMTPEMRARMERERRARAAEERMRRVAGGLGGGR